MNKFTLLLVMLFGLAAASTAVAQPGVYPGSFCNPWLGNTNGTYRGGSYSNQTSTTGFAYMECGVVVANTASQTYCVEARGEDNNSNASDNTVTLRVITRSWTTNSASGLQQSAGASKENFSLLDDRTLAVGDALFIEMGLPPCDISSGACDNYGDEVSYLSLYIVTEGGCPI